MQIPPRPVRRLRRDAAAPRPPPEDRGRRADRLGARRPARGRRELLAVPVRRLVEQAVLRRHPRHPRLGRHRDGADHLVRRRARVLGGDGITVRDDRGLCEHAGFCASKISNVWKLTKQTGDVAVRTQVAGNGRALPERRADLHAAGSGRRRRAGAGRGGRGAGRRSAVGHRVGTGGARRWQVARDAQPNGAVPLRPVEEQAAGRRLAQRRRLHRPRLGALPAPCLERATGIEPAPSVWKPEPALSRNRPLACGNTEKPQARGRVRGQPWTALTGADTA